MKPVSRPLLHSARSLESGLSTFGSLFTLAFFFQAQPPTPNFTSAKFELKPLFAGAARLSRRGWELYARFMGLMIESTPFTTRLELT